MEYYIDLYEIHSKPNYVLGPFKTISEVRRKALNIVENGYSYKPHIYHVDIYKGPVGYDKLFKRPYCYPNYKIGTINRGMRTPFTYYDCETETIYALRRDGRLGPAIGKRRLRSSSKPFTPPIRSRNPVLDRNINRKPPSSHI